MGNPCLGPITASSSRVHVSGAAERALHDLRTHALDGEAERHALRTSLEEERGGGALERLARLLLRVQPPPALGSGTVELGNAADGSSDETDPSAASVASRIEKLTAWAEDRVQTAEAAAEAAKAEVARLRLAMEAAPKPETLRAQAEQAAEARAASRTAACQGTRW